MTAAEQRTLQEFETRVRQLMLDFRRMRADNRALQRSTDEAQRQTQALRSENASLKQQLSALRLAHVVQMEQGDIKTARAKINKMLREIDKCIALLGA